MKKACFWGIMALMVLLFVGCGKEEEEKLKICVNAMKSGIVDSLVEAWQEIEGGSEVEIIEIVTDSGESEMKISELRTEIMAGKGPDVFLLECTPPEQEETHSELFMDLGKAMETGLFLSLDEYIENAKYINTSTWNQTVLDAGKTEEGQVVLPLYYRFPVFAYKSSDLPGKEIQDSWETFLASECPALENVSDSDFIYSFRKLADYETGNLTFSEEELKSYLEEYRLFRERIDAESDMQEVPDLIAAGWSGRDFFTQGVGGALEEEQTYISIPNRDGGVTAMVTMFAAVNKNTAKAEEAFSFLDFALSDEVTSGNGFIKDEESYGFSIDLSLGQEAVTVNQKAFEERYCKNQKVKDAFETLNDRIDCARFYSQLDRDLYETCYKYRFAHDSQTKDELVENMYETMQMKLAE